MIGIGRKRDRLLQHLEELEKPFFSGLDSEPGGGIVGNDSADADVSGEHLG